MSLRQASQKYACEDCEDEGVDGIPDPSDPNYDLLEMNERQLRALVGSLREELSRLKKRR